jgi:hypothetical protein
VESAVDELLETMRAAVDVLREKYPSLNQIAEEPSVPERHRWCAADVCSTQLEDYLNTTEERGWEIFTVLPKLPSKDERCMFVVIARRFKGDPHVE